MSGPRVAIHIPTYNQAQFLAHALEGALNQTYDDYEVIVSNNHSTDDTAQVIARYAGHPRLRVVMPPTFLIGREHFKFVVAQSRSEYFSYLCSDDGLLPGFLAGQVALLDRYPTAAFAHCAAQMIDGDGRLLYLEKSIKRTGLTPGAEAFVRFIENARCVGDSVLFRRAQFDQVGGFGDLYVLDWEVELLLCTVGDVAYNQDVLMQFRLWDAPERTNPSRLALMRGVNAFYDLYQPRFPAHRRAFERARMVRALASVDSLPGMTADERASALAEIRKMCPSPLVEAKIKAFDLGLARPWLALAGLRLKARNAVKALLYPILAP